MIDEKKLIDKLNRMEGIVDNYRSDTRQTCLNLICEIKDFIYEQERNNKNGCDGEAKTIWQTNWKRFG